MIDRWVLIKAKPVLVYQSLVVWSGDRIGTMKPYVNIFSLLTLIYVSCLTSLNLKNDSILFMMSLTQGFPK